MLPPGLQIPQAPTPITYTKLLIVEGRTAFEFFKALLRRLDLLDQIEIRNLGGNQELSDFLELLRMTPGFAAVTSLGIVRDAEKDVAGAFRSVTDALRRAGLSVPDRALVKAIGYPTVSVFILPNCASSGMLETLCLQSIGNDPAIRCIDEYFKCLETEGVELPANLTKARTHAFLASRPRPDLLVGQAAHAGYWRWENEAFDPLKEFLNAL
jgi:hypothetical protein